MFVLEAKELFYSYVTKYLTVEALKGVSCIFETGNFYAITGESGSGKTTLLSLLAGLDLPASGEIFVNGQSMTEIDRDLYRRKIASVVYQSFNLFPLLNAQENIMYPMELNKVNKRDAAKKAAELISRVGLDERILKQYPTMMSGGQQQRVAIARALAAGGKILLADEPTGNIDVANEEIVVNLLKELAHESGYMVIVITHNQNIATEADVKYVMRDGILKQ